MVTDIRNDFIFIREVAALGLDLLHTERKEV